MARILAIANQKGGVGKSTTAINLSAALAEQGRRVLVVDGDPQGNTTSGLGIEKASLERCVYDVLVDEVSLEQVVVSTGHANLFLAPATLRLAGAEIELVTAISRESRLVRALAPVSRHYDYVFIDCPPSLGLLTVNSMTAAHGVLIPIQCEFYALEGLTQLMKVIELVKHHLNPALGVDGVLLTMYDSRLNLTNQVSAEVRQFFGSKVFQAVIPRNVKLSEAPSFGQSVLAYDPRSRGAEAYRDLAKEVMQGEQVSVSSEGSGSRPVSADSPVATRRPGSAGPECEQPGGDLRSGASAGR